MAPAPLALPFFFEKSHGAHFINYQKGLHRLQDSQE
jgi:hypothetical protein